jgi:catalase-peroxidase
LILPLAASVMGLIYVNPEGADGKPDPILSANHIRTTFGRMGMNDEETVALIAGGHAFGKAHGARAPEVCKGKVDCPEAKGALTNTSGIEGSWTSSPAMWTHKYLSNLYKYDWKLQKGPSGKYQWYAPDLAKEDMAPDAHDPSKLVPIMMLTTDLSLKMDPQYNVISRRFLDNPTEFEDAFAKAWFKLIHRDLGPKSRYLGNDFPKNDFLFQDPIPAVNHKLIDANDIAELKRQILSSPMSVSDGVKTAWAAAATFRSTDKRGGVNGARIRLEPENKWEVNEPQLLSKNLAILKGIQEKFNGTSQVSAKAKRVSLADLIVLAGNVQIEQAAAKAGETINIPFTPGRMDASQEQTEIPSFEFLKVTSDGFRNYYNAKESYLEANAAFVDRADMLDLTKQEMAVLTAGLRVLGANYQDSELGVLTKTPCVLTNDFFVNLLDTSTKWTESTEKPGVFVGSDAETNSKRWTATSQDLIFGINPDLRLVSYSYGTVNAKRKFVTDFVGAWTKVMNLDRFDLK